MDSILVQTLLMLLLPHDNGEDDMGEILNISDAEFDATISNNEFVLVDFWAPWCGPCKMIGPVLDQISSERDDVQIVKVNTDTDSMNAAKLGVRGIPALFMFKDGKVVGNLSGAKPKAQLSSWIDQHVTADDF